MSTDIEGGRRWYRLIGPWPLRPGIIFFFAWYFYLATATGQLLGQQNVEPAVWLRSAVVLAVPAAAVMGIVLAVGRAVQRRRGVRPVQYWLTLLIAAIGALAVRFLIGAIPGESLSAPVPILVGIMRTMMLMAITLAIAGALTDRLQRQVDATSQALDMAREQQELMLEADEAARRQVAALLHDRVQAGLIAACLELQLMSASSSPAQVASLQQLVDRLENLRNLDVRRAVRALSPNLHDVDLRTALEELAAQYEPGMGATVRVARQIDARREELGDEVVLAVYRIVEQALLNSATHGQASHCMVRVELEEPWVTVSVIDDGRGVQSSPGQGLGSAVLTTWTRLFEGTWKLVGGQQGGAELRVTLGMHRQH